MLEDEKETRTEIGFVDLDGRALRNLSGSKKCGVVYIKSQRMLEYWDLGNNDKCNNYKVFGFIVLYGIEEC